MLHPESLHDATLLKIELDWATGEVLISIRASIENTAESKKYFIKCSNFSLINIPRIFEWGASNSINEVIIRENKELALELQSGDTIQLIGESISMIDSE